MLFNKKQTENEELHKEKYIVLEPKTFPFDDDSEVYYNSMYDIFEKIPAHKSMMLKFMNEFKTIDEHANFIHAKISGTIQISEIINEINSLINNGIMISREEIITKICENHNQDCVVSGISSIGWVTNKRLPELQMSIESFAENTASYGRKVPFMVCDDSNTDNHDIMGVLSAISKKYGIDIYYSDREEKAKLFEKLHDELHTQGVRKEVLEFMLLNPYNQMNTCGANRNDLLLSTAGNNTLWIDDDIMSTAYIAGDNDDMTEFTSEKNPLEINYYPDRKKLFENKKAVKVDILASHETILGKTAVTIFSESSRDDMILDYADHVFMASLLNSNGKIRITMSGIAGSSGMGSPRSILWAKGIEREKTYYDNDTYRSCVCSNEVFRYTDNMKISNGSFLMGYNMGLDNTEILPPFFPITRASDQVFATLFRKIFKDDLLGYLPYAIFHDPNKKKSFVYDDLFNIRVHLSDIILFIIESFQISKFQKNPLLRLNMLGYYFKEISCLGHGDFYKMIKLEVIKQFSGYIKFLEIQLSSYDECPSYWADDVYKTIDLINVFITENDFILPSELDMIKDLDDREKILKDILNNLGDLLIHWELIWKTAKEINLAGKNNLRKIC